MYLEKDNHKDDPTVKHSLLSIFRKSGDDHLGQTLTRLARLAVSAHYYEAAPLRTHTQPLRKEQRQSHGLNALPTVHPTRTDAGSTHTEVNP